MRILAIAFLFVLITSVTVQAWAGSQTIDIMLTEDGWLTRTISVLDYQLNEKSFVTFLAETQTGQVLGEVSATRYWDLFGKLLYTTAGLKFPIYCSAEIVAPFLRLTYRF